MSRSRYFEESSEEGQIESDEPRSSRGHKYQALKNADLSLHEDYITPPSSSGSRFYINLSCMNSENDGSLESQFFSSNMKEENKKVPDVKLKRNQSFQVPCDGGGRAQNIVYQSLPRSAINERNKSTSLPSSARSSGLKMSCLDSRSSDPDSPLSGELGDDSPFARGVDILAVPVEEVASELTLLDLDVFRRIQPEELNSCSWTSKNKHQTAPNVVSFTRRFNFVSFWVIQEVLNRPDPKVRGEVISYFLRVAKKLNELNSLHSLFAVLSALKSEPVYRLKQTWRYVSKRELQLYDKLFDLFDSANNFGKLRLAMDSLKLPCIPYLGFFLTDLIHVDTAHPKNDDWSRSNRQLKVNNILRIIASYQESDYSFLKSRSRINGYLQSVRYIEECQKFVEEDQFKKSMLLEPLFPNSASKESLPRSTPNTPGESPSKCSRKNCGTGFVPGHRKCQSLGNRFRSASLPRNPARPRQSFQVRRSHIFRSTSNQRKGRNSCHDLQDQSENGENLPIRHLIDDSVISDNLSSTSTSIHSHCPSPDSDVFLKTDGRSRSLDSLEDYSIPPIPEIAPIIIEGCLRRKTVRKRGRSPSTSFWHCFWAQLRNRQLLLFPPKSLTIGWPSDRHQFREDGFKVLLLSDWSTSADDLKHQESLVLKNNRTGDIYKYKAPDTITAREWLCKLKIASQPFQPTSSPDLIKFE